MPLDYGSRNITSGSNSPYIPLITNNPAFQVEIVPLDGRMEQHPNQKDDSAQQEAIKVGDTIRGESLSKTRKRGEKVMGRVLGIEKENNEIVSFKIITQRGEEVHVDPTTATKIQVNGNTITGSPDTNTTFEHRILLFEEWKSNNRLRS